MKYIEKILPAILLFAALWGMYFQYMTHKKLTSGCDCGGHELEAESAGGLGPIM